MKDFIQGMWVPQNLRALPPYDIIELLMPYHIMSCHLSLYCCIICDVISQNWARHNPHAKHRSFLRLGCRSVSTSDPVEIEGPPRSVGTIASCSQERRQIFRRLLRSWHPDKHHASRDQSKANETLGSFQVFLEVERSGKWIWNV